jgi:LacI family repressor for deo operon, udp, cdd, tsx, nupC, and nupG
MVRYLIGQGHRRIAHIAGADSSLEARERSEGYSDALRAAGLPVDPALIWRGASNYDFGSGERAAARYFAASDRPTAVFAAADEMALGFMRALKNQGIDIPRDVSVAGFDDTEYAVHYDPALTTMRQPRTELGRLAAKDLLRRMTGKDGETATSHVRLRCELVVRESVGAIGS